MANSFLVKKTTGPSVTLRVEGADEAEALQRAKDGDGTIIDGPDASYEIVRPETADPEGQPS